jgi:hypothetical protein
VFDQVGRMRPSRRRPCSGTPLARERRRRAMARGLRR